MNTAAVRANRRKLLILAAIVLLCAAGYMLVDVNFSNPKLLAYAMKIRTPKLIVMLITAFAIGGAICVIGQLILNGWLMLLPQDDAATATSVSLVFLSALFTGLNLYNKLARFGGAGTLVPITGFANAVASPAIDFRAED